MSSLPVLAAKADHGIQDVHKLNRSITSKNWGQT